MYSLEHIVLLTFGQQESISGTKTRLTQNQFFQTRAKLNNWQCLFQSETRERSPAVKETLENMSAIPSAHLHTEGA